MILSTINSGKINIQFCPGTKIFQEFFLIRIVCWLRIAGPRSNHFSHPTPLTWWLSMLTLSVTPLEHLKALHLVRPTRFTWSSYSRAITERNRIRSCRQEQIGNAHELHNQGGGNVVERKRKVLNPQV